MASVGAPEQPSSPWANDPVAFLHDVTFDGLPGDVIETAKLCLLDLVAVAAAGSHTHMSRITRNHVAANFASPGDGRPMLFDGRRASPVGVALAGAATIDSMDGHDGHALTKGHAGAAVLPALLSLAAKPISGREFLTALVIGYEMATRAGIALHATVSDYHSSGSWNALGCAAVGARLLKLSAAETAHALGIAEYHGPRSQMMRCIDEPTMVKDGSAWGSAVGVSAALLARDGFTGAPALTTSTPQELWADLGQRWRIREQYLKPYPVCRWAHPAIQAALDLRSRHDLAAASIETIEVRTFHAATRLATRQPQNTEQAQYSLPFNVAAALVHGSLGPEHINEPRRADQQVRRLSAALKLVEHPDHEQCFPAIRRADVVIGLYDGSTLRSGPTTARGEPHEPLTQNEVRAKFRAYTTRSLHPDHAARILDMTEALSNADSASGLINELMAEPKSLSADSVD